MNIDPLFYAQMGERKLANEKNLIPNSERTPSELREMTQKGGRNSGISRRRKKAMKTQAKLLMDLPAPENLQQKMRIMGIGEEDATYQMGVMVAMLQQALGGNVKAAQFIRELVGEDPKQEMQKKELKLRQDEFKYKKEQDEKAAEETSLSGSLADAIMEAYDKRMETEGEDDVEE